MRIKFQHQAVRDLAWVIASPSLLSGTYNCVEWWDDAHNQAEYEACLPTLKHLDQSPKPLLEHLKQVKSYRLGHYFESLVAYWLHITPNYKLLWQQVQIFQNKQTLGELDFIIRDTRTQKVLHLEVAVKFYLGLHDIQHMWGWYGTNLNDRLDIKFQLLRDKQTQLAKQFPELMPCTIDVSACWIKGRLFYPVSHTAKANFATQNHLSSTWYDAAGAPSQNAVALNKPQWLSPLTCATSFSDPHAVTKAQCYAQFEQAQEKQRFFSLPASFWSELAAVRSQS